MYAFHVDDIDFRGLSWISLVISLLEVDFLVILLVFRGSGVMTFQNMGDPTRGPAALIETFARI